MSEKPQKEVKAEPIDVYNYEDEEQLMNEFFARTDKDEENDQEED